MALGPGATALAQRNAAVQRQNVQTQQRASRAGFGGAHGANNGAEMGGSLAPTPRNPGMTKPVVNAVAKNVKASAKPTAPKAAKAPAVKAPAAAKAKGTNLGNGISSTNPLLNPNATLSGKALYQAALGVANAQTQPTINALNTDINSQKANTTAQLGQVGGFYNQLGQQAQDASTNATAAGSALNSQLGQIGTSAQQQLQALGAQAQTGGLDNLAKMGLGAGSQTVQAELARQQGLQAQQTAADQTYGATQGANYQGLAASGQTADATQGVAGLKGIAQAGQANLTQLGSKLSTAQDTKSADLASALEKLRQNEVTNQLSQESEGTTAAKDAATASNDAATQANARQRNSIAAQNDQTNAQLKAAALKEKTSNDQALLNLRSTGLKITSQNDTANQQLKAQANAIRQETATGKGKPKALTTEENNRMSTNLNEIVNAIPKLQQGGIKDSKGNVITPKPSEAEIRSLLGSEYPDALVQAAYELDGWGHITPSTANQLKSMGMRGGTFRGGNIRVAPAPKAGGTKGAQKTVAGLL